ncbi:hypothetical protein ABT116_19170 [Streptomyces sp. NPDC002130]|uniref:hypothetical protein n=1 Tax=Streptomyces sp. NPDC002130 TaxID=3155568 RepID=UPI00332247C4
MAVTELWSAAAGGNLELLIIFLCIGAVIWLVSSDKKDEEEKARKKRQAVAAEATRLAQVTDPAWMSTEIVRAVQSGDAGHLEATAAELPDWPIRDPLVQSARWLLTLHAGTEVAERAAVHRALTDEVRAGTAAAMTALSMVTVKVVSLARFFSYDWRQLPEEPRRLLERDATRLHGISEAAYALHHNLGVAMAAGTAHEADAAGRHLLALAETIRELSEGMEEE